MLIIKQAQIVDGSGSKPFAGDILINGDRISAIGKSFSPKKTDKVMDGLGLTAVPGFIDVNNDADHHLSLFTNPGQADFLKQGITTIICGHCGASLAPLMYGSLASINRWVQTDRINVDWTTLADLKRILKDVGLNINFETLAGYSTIRRDVAGGVEIRDLTASEMDVFKSILEQAFKDGALGVSTGLGFLESKFVPHAEIKRIVSLAAAKGKVYTTHLRDEKDGLIKSVEETILVSRETGAKTMISHFRPLSGYEKNFSAALNLLEKNLVDANVYFDVNPFTETIFPIHTYLPYWAQSENADLMLANIKDKESRKKILKELGAANLERLIVADARGSEILAGKSILDLSRDRGKPAAEIVLDLMESTNMNAMLMSKDLNAGLLMPLLSHPRSFIGTNSSSMPLSKSGRGLKMERASSTFSSYLKTVLAQGTAIETAIKKITFSPAQFFGLKQIGLLKEGNFADLVLLKGNETKNVIFRGKLLE